MTQQGLSAKTGIPQPNLAALEAGRLDPKLSTLRRIAVALELSPGKLVDERPPSSGWNRHRIDALVRSAATLGRRGRRGRGRWGEGLRIVAASRLAAAGQSVSLRGRTGERLIKQLQADLGPRAWAAVVRRLDKLL